MPTNLHPRRRISFISCLLLVLAIPLLFALAQGQAAPSSACADVQNTQNYTFLYGNATVNGQQVSVGSVIAAYNPRGDIVGCQITTTAGQYGLIYVYGEETVAGTLIPGMQNGETVTFTIDGVPASASPQHQWSNDWTPHQVALSASFTSPPPAVVNLSPTFNGGDLSLSWPDVGGSVHHYQVWRSSTPYFNPATPGAQQLGVDIPSLHSPGSLISVPDVPHLPNQNDFYIVVAIDTLGQVSAPGNGVGLIEYLVVPGANPVLSSDVVVYDAASQIVQAAPQVLPVTLNGSVGSALAPDVPTTAHRYNHIALALDASATIVPFTAQGLLNYIGPAAILVANLNTNSQTLNFWDRSLEFGIVNDIPIFDPNQYPLEVGHPYLVLIDSTHPADTPFTALGNVPDADTIHFTLAGSTPCKYNEIVIPLDQYNSGISNGVELANAIGNIDLVAKLNPTSQALDFWDMSLGFGIVDGIPIYEPAEFPIQLGHAYFVCANAAASNTVWP